MFDYELTSMQKCQIIHVGKETQYIYLGLI